VVVEVEQLLLEVMELPLILEQLELEVQEHLIQF
jgi:hypothetical protein